MDKPTKVMIINNNIMMFIYYFPQAKELTQVFVT